MKKLQYKIRLIIYILIISLLLSLLYHSKITNSFELESTESIVNLFIRPQPPSLLPVSPSSLSTSLPLLTTKKKRNYYSFNYILLIILIITLTSICLTFIIREIISKKKRILKKFKDIEFGSYTFEEIEFEHQQILYEKRRNRMSFIIQNQLPTIYEES